MLHFLFGNWDGDRDWLDLWLFRCTSSSQPLWLSSLQQVCSVQDPFHSDGLHSRHFHSFLGCRLDWGLFVYQHAPVFQLHSVTTHYPPAFALSCMSMALKLDTFWGGIWGVKGNRSLLNLTLYLELNWFLSESVSNSLFDSSSLCFI